MDTTLAPPSLVEASGRAMSPDLLTRAAGMLGESSSSVKAGLGAMVPSILGQAASRSQDTGFMQQVFGWISNPAFDAPRDPSSLLTSASEAGSPVAAMGESLVAALFGDRTPAVAEGLARATGMRAASSKSLLLLAASLALGVLRGGVREARVTPGGFAQWFGSQAPGLNAAMPAWLADVMKPGLVGAPRVEAPPRIEPPPTPRPVAPAPPPERATSKLAYIILGVLVLAGLVWGLANRGAEEGPVAGPGVEAPGPTITRQLPTGVTLEYPQNSLEASLLRAINAGEGPGAGWFDFDRLAFETDSATLSASSQPQLQNIARILEAYPNVVVEVAGFTDNQGDPAANLELSQRRAEGVAQALGTLGVGSDRLQARGYGEAEPLASNADEAGRARNRRVSIRILSQ
ncbi:MAG: OmpA family protein [Pseudomonadota bacterium]|nr:OmpA family protein [Pseudomonadota bacterium]